MSRLNSIPWVGITMLALLLSMTNAQRGEYIKRKDENIPIMKRVRDMLRKMTLAEKIGQMVQIERSFATPDVLRNYSIGSVVSAAGSKPCHQATAIDWVDMVNTHQNGALSSRLGIPVMYAIDATHGNGNVYGATIFPHNIGLGATRDPDLLRRIGEATALEVKATGVPYVFSPNVAVCRDPRWGRCYESYSEDPKLVQDMTSIIDGLQGNSNNSRRGVPYISETNKVAACAKHYVGDGGTTRGINENNTEIDWHGLLSIHMPGYYSAVIKGVASIMVSSCSLNGVKMHASYPLLTKFLKGNLRFRGFIISDWQGIDQIPDPPYSNYTYSVQMSINAGIDMVMVPYNYTVFIDTLRDLVHKNVVPMTRIDDAVTRILRVKFSLGLFDYPIAEYNLKEQVGSQEHRDLAREAVRKSLVLLKNGKNEKNPMLPLPKKADKVLVAGAHANNLGYQCGGWTISWQGIDGNNLTVGTTILNAIISTVHPRTEMTYNHNPDPEFVKSQNFSYAIVVVGELPYAETTGGNPTLTLVDPGPDIINNVCGAVQCVVVLITGRPMVMAPYMDTIDALVAAWLPGTEGQGVADVLFGDYGFTGKLSRTWFRSVDQLPMNVGDPNYDPLFPFGFGLTTQPVKPNGN